MEAHPVTMAQILDRAGWLFGMEPAAMLSHSRRRRYVMARNAVALAARATNRSFPQIARDMGGRDHTTIMYACKSARALAGVDSAYAAKVEKLLAYVRANAANDCPAPANGT